MKKEKKDDYSIFLCGGMEPEPIPGEPDYEAKLKAYKNFRKIEKHNEAVYKRLEAEKKKSES